MVPWICAWGKKGKVAADIVNDYDAEETLLKSFIILAKNAPRRRIARAIVELRAATPITRTLQLAGLIEKCMPRQKPGQSHPATRSFQALRIAVNDEYGELVSRPYGCRTRS